MSQDFVIQWLTCETCENVLQTHGTVKSGQATQTSTAATEHQTFALQSADDDDIQDVPQHPSSILVKQEAGSAKQFIRKDVKRARMSAVGHSEAKGAEIIDLTRDEDLIPQVVTSVGRPVPTMTSTIKLEVAEQDTDDAVLSEPATAGVDAGYQVTTACLPSNLY